MKRRDLLSLSGGLLAAPSATRPDSPVRSARLYDPRAYGAKADSKALDSPAINTAIEACHRDGGGVVYLAPGTYLSGTVVLRSNVTLYIEAGATLLGSREIGDYTPQSGPSPAADANDKHLIFARDAENVGIAGPGLINGQGPAFWVPSGRRVPPPEEAWQDVATYDWKPLPRPSPLIEFCGCRHVRIEDIRIENAAGWTLRPVQCDHVWIHGIHIHNPVIGPNTDGIDVTGCNNLVISDCVIDTGDDAICLKSESPYGGEVRLSSNITVTNCVLSCCCNGFKFGTATRGGFENVTFSNSVIFNRAVDYRARVIAGIAIEMVDGGWLEGVVVSGIRMQRVRTPIFVRRGNRRPRPDGSAGTLRGVRIENVHASGAILTSSITGIPGFPVEDVTLSGIRIDSEEAGPAEWGARVVPEQISAYPEARMFGRLPAYGFYCRHARGVRLRDVVLGAVQGEARPALVCDDVAEFDVDGLRSAAVASAQPVVKLISTRDTWLRSCLAPAGTEVYLAVEGATSSNIALSGSRMGAARRAVALGKDVLPAAVAQSANEGQS